MFCLRKKGSQGGSKIVDGVYLTLRDGIKQEYLNCPWNTSLGDWYKKWFTFAKSLTALRCATSGIFQTREWSGMSDQS
jgi:hypothetical protein